MLGLGIAYYIWIRITGLAIPCIFRKVTGWRCPGCGITTLILCVLDFDFSGAFNANPFLFVTGPVLMAELVYYFWIREKRKPLPRWNHWFIILYTAALCIYGILRNIR